MNTKKTEKSFTPLKTMRDILSEISTVTQNMSYEELKKYIEVRLNIADFNR